MARTKVDEKTKERGMSFSQKLKIQREKKKLTQRELSERANIPLDTLRSIENGRVLAPSVFIAADLVHALDGKLDGWILELSPIARGRTRDT